MRKLSFTETRMGNDVENIPVENLQQANASVIAAEVTTLFFEILDPSESAPADGVKPFKPFKPFNELSQILRTANSS